MKLTAGIRYAAWPHDYPQVVGGDMHKPIVRLDKFKIPNAARQEFLMRVGETHQILRQQPGFIRDAIWEQISGPGCFNIITLAEWKSRDDIEAAKEVVREQHAKRGFNARDTMERLGVEADMADYTYLDV